jgi:hypothetical protein
MEARSGKPPLGRCWSGRIALRPGARQARIEVASGAVFINYIAPLTSVR